MSPENQWLEDVFPIKLVPFRGHSLVSGWCIHLFCCSIAGVFVGSVGISFAFFCGENRKYSRNKWLKNNMQLE